jgi:DNA-directed RNA polymerase subunit RPC12/RpoP
MTQLTKCCSNPLCGRPFQVNRFHAEVSPSTEAGQIVCPHCGSRVAGDHASIFLTHALLGEEEVQFMEQLISPGKSMR